jgi:hypothetical protein
MSVNGATVREFFPYYLIFVVKMAGIEETFFIKYRDLQIKEENNLWRNPRTVMFHF